MTTSQNIIAQASQSIANQGYTGYYQYLAKAFVGHSQLPTYQQFVNRTCRATLPLQCLNEAMFYSVAYGLQHYKTFFKALSENIVIDMTDSILNVVDYGCGQGVASIALLDFLAQTHTSQNVPLHVNFCLIEPSAVSLSIAEKILTQVANHHGISITITTQCVPLAQAVISDFGNTAMTFHLMSYILDVPAVQQQIGSITRQIQQLQGTQFIVATCPTYTSSYEGFALFSNAFGYSAPIVRQSIAHNSYRVIQQRFCEQQADTISMVIILENLAV